MTNKEKWHDEIWEIAVINDNIVAIDRETNEPRNCRNFRCADCLRRENKKTFCCSKELFIPWLNSEYVEPKTNTEKFCETLKVGEVIAVSDNDENLIKNFTYLRFEKYDAEKDQIRTTTGYYYPSSWKYGRKLTAEERGEK